MYFAIFHTKQVLLHLSPCLGVHDFSREATWRNGVKFASHESAHLDRERGGKTRLT